MYSESRVCKPSPNKVWFGVFYTDYSAFQLAFKSPLFRRGRRWGSPVQPTAGGRDQQPEVP